MIHDEANPRGSWAPRCGRESKYGRGVRVSVPERPLPIDCPHCIDIARRQVQWYADGMPGSGYAYPPILFAADASLVLGGLALGGLFDAVGLA